MSLAHRYDEFDQDRSEDGEENNAVSAASADAKLEAFESGYQAGWQDASAALEAEQDKISADLAQNLQDISFTYQEARTKLLVALKPVVDAIFSKLVPSLLDGSLRTHVLEQIQELLEKMTDSAIEIAVCPQNMDTMKTLLDQRASPPFVLTPDPDIGEGQVYLRVNQSERCIDLDELSKNVSDALDTFFQQTEEGNKNG